MLSVLINSEILEAKEGWRQYKQQKMTLKNQSIRRKVIKQKLIILYSSFIKYSSFITL